MWLNKEIVLYSTASIISKINYTVKVLWPSEVFKKYEKYETVISSLNMRSSKLE